MNYENELVNQGNYGMNEVEIPKEYKPLSPWAYLGYNILFGLPIVGLMFLSVFAFNNENINRRNYARSYICTMIVMVIFMVILYASLMSIVSIFEKSIFEEPKIEMPSAQQIVGRAGFSGFTTDVDSVRTAFITEKITSLMGEQVSNNNPVTEAQAYNYLAKGATTTYFSDTDKEHMWLSRGQAGAIPCTRIEKESALESLEIELPVRTVNTYAATGVEMSYFVTNKGDIFVWPPYRRATDGLFYVNDVVCVTTPEGKAITDDDEILMYEDGFEFVVDGVTIKVSNKTENTDNILTSNTSREELENMASIYYKDERNPESPEGIESKFVYDDRTGGESSEIVGVDQD